MVTTRCRIFKLSFQRNKIVAFNDCPDILWPTIFFMITNQAATHPRFQQFKNLLLFEDCGNIAERFTLPRRRRRNKTKIARIHFMLWITTVSYAIT